MINSFWHTRESTVGIRWWPLAEILSPGLLPIEYLWKQVKNYSVKENLKKIYIFKWNIFYWNGVILSTPHVLNELPSDWFPSASLFQMWTEVSAKFLRYFSTSYVWNFGGGRMAIYRTYLNRGRWSSWLKWLCFCLSIDSSFTWQYSLPAKSYC